MSTDKQGMFGTGLVFLYLIFGAIACWLWDLNFINYVVGSLFIAAVIILVVLCIVCVSFVIKTIAIFIWSKMK